MPATPQQPEQQMPSPSEPPREAAPIEARQGWESEDSESPASSLPPSNIMRRARLRSFPEAGNVTPFPAPTAMQGWVVESQVIEETDEFDRAPERPKAPPARSEQDNVPFPVPPDEPAPPTAQVAPTITAALVGGSESAPAANTALMVRPDVPASATPGYAIADLPDSTFRKLSQLEAQSIGFMRTWLKDEGSKPDSTIGRLSPGEQVQLALDAVNTALGRNLQQGLPPSFASLAQAYLFGWGPLDHLMRLEEVTEVMVNGAVSIFIERRGQLEFAGPGLDDEAIYSITERMTGRRPTMAEPMLDDRLKDGSRLNATHASVSLLGATLSIRRFPQVALEAEDLIRNDALTPELLRFLEALIRGRMNIVISGGTNTGKTTLLNVLLGAVPISQRLVIIEQAPAEIRCALPNRAHLLTRPRTADGAAEVSVAALVRNALRMRPDRIVVGECRGGEALAMMQAMNTGHAGSLTTLHANNPQDALSRLETMVLMAESGLPHEAIRAQIARAIQIVVQTRRSPHGQRYVSEVVQVTPSSDSASGYACATLFEAPQDQSTLVSRRTRASLDPSLREQMLSYGVRFDELQVAAAPGLGH